MGQHDPAARLLAPAILGLCATDPEHRWSLERLDAYLSEPAPDPVPLPTGVVVGGRGTVALTPQIYQRILDDGLAWVVATIGTDDAGRLWPSTAFGATTEPTNVQHGAAGVLALLTHASGSLGRDDLTPVVARVAGWIQRRLPRITPTLPGIYFGQSGVAWALWEASRLLGDDELADYAAEVALAVPVRWPNPDVFHGAAGAGMVQLHLWYATGRAEFLKRVTECAEGLLATASHTEDGVFWPVPVGFDSILAGIHHFGFAHGVAGIGTFLIDAARATGQESFLTAARAAAATLGVAAERGPWGARWRADRTDAPGTGMLYLLCNGSAGVGTFLIRLWQATGDSTALDLAEQAASAAYRTRWFGGSSVCHGLAGNAHFLLDMASATGDDRYRDQAEELAVCMYARHVRRRGLLLIPDESGMEVAIDYQVGLAGVLGVLLRLRHGGPRPWLVTPVAQPAHRCD